jgi:phage-related protein
VPKRLRAVYYRARDGSEPVSDSIDALPVKQQVVLDNQIDRINELCTTTQPDLPFPHSSQVEGQSRELRCHFGCSLYRILYRHSGTFVILLHALSKATANYRATAKRLRVCQITVSPSPDGSVESATRNVLSRG